MKQTGMSQLLSRSVFSAILVLMLSGSCSEPIEFNFESEEDVLVVDGFITNQFKQHLIRLSFTSSKVDNIPIPNPARFARVELHNDQGEVFVLQNGGNGNYLTPAMFAEEGRSYQLRVEVNGKVYISEFEELPKAGPTPELEIAINDQDFRNIQQGSLIINRRGASIHAVIDKTATSNKNNVHYQWFVSDCRDFSNTPGLSSRICSVFGDITREPQLYLHRDPYIAGSVDLNYSYELTWIPKPLEGNVSGTLVVEIDQFIISQKAFEYWSDINETIVSRGTLFSPAVTRIFGNIKEESTGHLTLGFFGVYGEASTWRRIRLGGF